MARLNSPEELERFRKDTLSERDPDKPCITLCSGTACHATGCEEVAAAIEQEIGTGQPDTAAEEIAAPTIKSSRTRHLYRLNHRVC